MTEAEAKNRSNNLYESDFYAWTQEQTRLLRERRWSDLDLENLIDEVASVGSSEKREIRNRLTKLLAHLLKWRYQPSYRGSSWKTTIRDQRTELASIIEDSPSLAGYMREQVARRYPGATLEAASETGIAIGVFPEVCPFTIDEVLGADFFPEDRNME